MVNSKHRQGVSYYLLGRYAEAISLLNEAHAEDPSNPETLVIASWCFYKTRRAPSGLTVAAKALSINPTYVRALIVHSACAAQTGKFKLATESITSALSLAPDDAFAHYHHAFLLAMKKNYKKSLDSIELAISLDPSDATYQTYRSHLLSVLGKKSEAKLAALEALRLDPEAAPSHLQHGKVLRSEGRISASLESILEALRNDPTNKAVRKEFLMTTRSRFLPYRWCLAADQWLRRYPRWMRIVFSIGCSYLVIGLIALSDRIPFFLVIGLVLLGILASETIVVHLSPAILDGLLVLNPKYRLVISRDHRFVALLSVAFFGLGLISICASFVFRNSFVQMVAISMNMSCMMIALAYRLIAEESIVL